MKEGTRWNSWNQFFQNSVVEKEELDEAVGYVYLWYPFWRLRKNLRPQHLKMAGWWIRVAVSRLSFSQTETSSASTTATWKGLFMNFCFCEGQNRSFSFENEREKGTETSRRFICFVFRNSHFHPRASVKRLRAPKHGRPHHSPVPYLSTKAACPPHPSCYKHAITPPSPISLNKAERSSSCPQHLHLWGHLLYTASKRKVAKQELLQSKKRSNLIDPVTRARFFRSKKLDCLWPWSL